MTKFSNLYNSIMGEAKIDKALEGSLLPQEQAAKIRSINDKLDNQTKYAEWLVNNIDDVDDSVVDVLNYFEKYQSRFDEKDINKYSYDSLKAKIEELKAVKTKSEKSIEASKDALKVFENDKCIVLNIKTEQAAKKYGRGTKWCISAENNNQWNKYTLNRNSFYFLISKEKSGHKYAFAIRPDMLTNTNQILCYNAEDKLLNTPLLVMGEYKVNKSLFGIKENLPDPLLNKACGLNMWEIDEDGYVNAKSSVYVYEGMVKNGKLKYKFGRVNGSFNCNDMELTTLEGSPSETYAFECSKNKLTSLEGGPKMVYGAYAFHDNKISSFKGMPKEICTRIEGFLDMNKNEFTSMEGCPDINGCSLYVNENKLISLKGCPETVQNFHCVHNKLTSLEGAPKTVVGNFHCEYNSKKFTKEDVEKVSNVVYEISC